MSLHETTVIVGQRLLMGVRMLTQIRWNLEGFQKGLNVARRKTEEVKGERVAGSRRSRMTVLLE